MLVEMRTYQITAGKTGEFLDIYEREGLGIISQYARLKGCWTKDSGTLNSIVFCWGYEGYGHRAAQRAKLAVDPRWQAFTPRILPYLLHQESVFLSPVPFCPMD
ncbi:hypothetical protein HDG32_000271 [Paraburkholderia sp. CI2]|uniref:NIPSNAP family protein n=1 Tax=Paraburkholderia sp. CI2 TaxID=2723093 RepID=UPI00161832BA|nr:NIPSNAP family protein [Paraburkholderia sp. CI2]MBB5464178.1 hypothetical protein [Paraburkholderia sp. CI2]